LDTRTYLPAGFAGIHCSSIPAYIRNSPFCLDLNLGLVFGFGEFLPEGELTSTLKPQNQNLKESLKLNKTL